MARKRIFIVEDEEEIQELVRYNHTKEGFHVLGTDSGEEALRKIPRERPDLVVLDLMLPGVDGLEVCRSLKSESSTRDIPIVMAFEVCAWFGLFKTNYQHVVDTLYLCSA